MLHRHLYFTSLLFCTACSLHHVDDAPPLPVTVEVPAAFEAEPGLPVPEHWWHAFASEELDALIDEALANNYTLKQAWARLDQAAASLRAARSGFWPQISVDAGVTDTDLKVSGAGPTFAPPSETRYSAGVNLGYELDLWRRIGSGAAAAALTADAAQYDAEATALALTGQLTEAWLTAQEQKEQLKLLEEQLELNRTLLELVELRFSMAQASALDVYQQRQTLAATETLLPRARSALNTAAITVQTLLGRSSNDLAEGTGALPELPEAPQLPHPADLLTTRPDLRAARARVVAADYQVAQALAERLPALSLAFSYDISTTTLSDLLERQIRQLIGSVVQPLFDGGARSAEQQRNEAVVQERLHAFSQSFITAVAEVQTALHQEREQHALLEDLAEQEALTAANLREARQRYVAGLNDYLTVIAAVQSLQNIQRTRISEQRQLLSIRATLYRALGVNNFTPATSQEVSHELETEA